MQKVLLVLLMALCAQTPIFSQVTLKSETSVRNGVKIIEVIEKDSASVSTSGLRPYNSIVINEDVISVQTEYGFVSVRFHPAINQLRITRSIGLYDVILEVEAIHAKKVKRNGKVRETQYAHSRLIFQR